MERMIERLQLDPDYAISRVIKGGWQLARGHSERGLQDPLGDMHAFAALGIDTFNCADIYTGVEELIGDFLAENRASDHALPVKVHSK